MLISDKYFDGERPLYAPIYMTMFLRKRVSEEPLIYKVDMKGLK